jgi:hypothetical protein
MPGFSVMSVTQGTLQLTFIYPGGALRQRFSGILGKPTFLENESD